MRRDHAAPAQLCAARRAFPARARRHRYLACQLRVMATMRSKQTTCPGRHFQFQDHLNWPRAVDGTSLAVDLQRQCGGHREALLPECSVRQTPRSCSSRSDISPMSTPSNDASSVTSILPVLDLQLDHLQPDRALAERNKAQAAQAYSSSIRRIRQAAFAEQQRPASCRGSMPMRRCIVLDVAIRGIALQQRSGPAASRRRHAALVWPARCRVYRTVRRHSVRGWLPNAPPRCIVARTPHAEKAVTDRETRSRLLSRRES